MALLYNKTHITGLFSSPFMPVEFFEPCKIGKPICRLRSVSLILCIFKEIKTENIDQTPRSAASDLGLSFLPRGYAYLGYYSDLFPLFLLDHCHTDLLTESRTGNTVLWTGNTENLI